MSSVYIVMPELHFLLWHPKLKELILACAFRDKNISVWDLEELVKVAYPEDV